MSNLAVLESVPSMEKPPITRTEKALCPTCARTVDLMIEPDEFYHSISRKWVPVAGQLCPRGHKLDSCGVVYRGRK